MCQPVAEFYLMYEGMGCVGERGRDYSCAL
jgi:hypothetical protein